MATSADWACFADVRAEFPRADMIGEVLVFDLAHNRYRLITTVFFATREIYVKNLLTHKEYDREECEEMVLALSSFSSVKYGKLLAKALPKRIENDAEFERSVAAMEELSRAIDHGKAGPEERALHSLLSTLVREYDDRVEALPMGDPLELIRYLMDQRDLRPVDLTEVFGARSIASMVLSGKRELSKTHIRKLAAFFHVSPALFLGAGDER